MPAFPISSAAKRSVSDAATSVPSVQGSLLGWMRPMIFCRVVRKIVEGETKQSLVARRGLAVIQPFGDRQLLRKPEGERSWDWQMLHTVPVIRLANGEVFYLKGIKYRVVSQRNYSDYGYNAYELVQDFRSSEEEDKEAQVLNASPASAVADFSAADFSSTDFST